MVDTGPSQQTAHSFSAITRDQSKDTGMAMVLIMLILTRFFPDWSMRFVLAAMALLVVDMVWPLLFKPAAWAWFGLAHVMGTVMSKVLLSVVYLVVVLPVAMFRRIIGKDSLQLRRWKKGTASVFIVRDHQFVAGDIEHPY